MSSKTAANHCGTLLNTLPPCLCYWSVNIVSQWNVYTLLQAHCSYLQEECNKELGWYKAVKDTQGSVERSTFGQMGAIMEYGRYHVDSSTSKVVKSIHQIISVTLEERDQRLPKKLYTLDELRDLESKLVLITGSRAEHREKVDLFLHVSHRA